MAMEREISGNPYAGYGSVVLGRRLVGREKEITRILARLGSGSMSIIGEPRIGKTSLVKETLRRFRGSSRRTPFTWINLKCVSDSQCLFTEMADGIMEDLVDSCSMEIPESTARVLSQQPRDGYESWRRTCRVLKSLKKAGLTCIVVVDEFDAVRRMDDFTMQRLREMLIHHEDFGLSAVIVSRRDLSSLEGQVDGCSPLSNACEPLYVTPLFPSDLELMVGRAGPVWSLSAKDLRQLETHCGGHPYLAEMILCNGWEERSVEKGIAHSLASLFDYYEALKQLLQEDELFDQLLQLVVGPRWSLELRARERFARRGLVRQKAGSDSEFDAFSTHFTSYLEKASREAEGDLWVLWRETETAIRDFVERVYRDHLGEDWLEDLRGSNDGIKLCMGKCQERMEREVKNFGACASTRLLDYTYPMDLWSLINATWNCFQPHLGNTTSYWNERFSKLAKVRTPVSHSRELHVPEGEIALAQQYCRDLLKALRGSETAS